jgi:hypothetical protein
VVERALEVSVIFRTDFTPFEKGLKEAKNKATKAGAETKDGFFGPISEGAVKAAAVIAGVLVIAKKAINTIIGFGKAASDALVSAAERTRSQLTFEGTFGRLSTEANSFAATFSDALNIPIATAKGQLEDFQAFLTGSGLGPLKAFSEGTSLTEITGDLAAQTGKDFEKVGATIKASLLGNFRALAKEFNIIINDDLLQREGVRLGFIEKVTDELTKQQKLLLTIQQIQEQTSGLEGIGERESGSFDKQLDRFDRLIASVKFAFADAFLPAAEKLLKALNDQLEPFIEDLKGVANALAPIVSSIGRGVELFSKGDIDSGLLLVQTGLEDAATSFVNGIEDALANLAIDLKDKFPFLSSIASLVSGGVDVGQSIFKFFTESTTGKAIVTISSLLNPLTIALTALVPAIEALNEFIITPEDADRNRDIAALTEKNEREIREKRKKAADEDLAARTAQEEGVRQFWEATNKATKKQRDIEKKAAEDKKKLIEDQKKFDERELKRRDAILKRLERFDSDQNAAFDRFNRNTAERFQDIIEDARPDEFVGSQGGAAETLIGQIQDREFDLAERQIKLQEDIREFNEDTSITLKEMQKEAKRRRAFITTGLN